MAVCTWYFVKRDLSSVRYSLKGIRNTRPCLSGHPVQFVKKSGRGRDMTEQTKDTERGNVRSSITKSIDEGRGGGYGDLAEQHSLLAHQHQTIAPQIQGTNPTSL